MSREADNLDLPINYDNATWQERKAARLAYVALQEGMCWHCGEGLSGPASASVLAKKIDKSRFPPSMFNYPIRLHHDHTSGWTLGAVHAVCNAVLWQYHGE